MDNKIWWTSKQRDDNGGAIKSEPILLEHVRSEIYPLAKLLHGERLRQTARLVHVRPAASERHASQITTALAVIAKSSIDATRMLVTPSMAVHLQGTKTAQHVCFDECEYVRLSITVQTSALGITRYSERQLDLYRKIYRLRHVERLTFQAIAARLNTSGIKSTTGKAFSAELVFGLHKKGPAAKSSRSVMGLA